MWSTSGSGMSEPDSAAAPNTVVSFNICLTPGDSWTAAMSSEGLMKSQTPVNVTDSVAQNRDTRTVTHVATPKMGEHGLPGRGRQWLS